jgi:hypothetical protein
MRFNIKVIDDKYTVRDHVTCDNLRSLNVLFGKYGFVVNKDSSVKHFIDELEVVLASDVTVVADKWHDDDFWHERLEVFRNERNKNRKEC